MKPRILIDANPVVQNYLPGHHVSGIGRTTLELIKALNQIENIPVDIMLYSQNMKGIGGSDIATKFKCCHVYLRNNNICNKLSSTFRLRELLTKYDLMHITHNFEVVPYPEKCIVTLHDAFFMKINEQRFDHKTMRCVVPPFIKKCRHIITCSEYSKKDIIETMDVSPEKITVIPWGIDHDVFYVESNRDVSRLRLKSEFNISYPYFLSVSCNAERKRTDMLIRSYIKYITVNPTASNDLVLVWANPPIELLTEISNAGPEAVRRIHFLKNVSNDDLRLLYNCATASFTPSAYEGFGLPILEAMACGCPVVSAYNSSLPEVGGNAAFYLDEPIEATIFSAFADFEQKEIDKSSFVKNGMFQASKFTWQRAAEATIEVYLKALGME